jgi:hypothetical protein
MGPVRLAAVVGLALLAAACASGGGSGDSGPRRDRNLITGEELTQTGELTTLFDAIRRLRPTWLRGRGNLSAKVFIDGVELGGTGVLRDYRVDEVRECRFVPAADATMRFGTGYGGGVIQVFRK